MSPVKTTVTPISQESRNPLPSYLSRYVMLMGWLREWGLLSKISDHLRLPRNKGFQGIDLFMTVLAFFCGARWDGLHRFADETLRWGAQLAGIGGRARWPTQASLSRLMSSVSIEQARRFANSLLQDSLELSPLLHHDSVLHLDGKGDGWHVFDFDPTSTVMRQRALPSDPDLPQAHRLSDGLAAPGYTGRKRGETKISRPCLQHRGARLWLSVDQKPGNGEWAADVAQATQSVERVAERHRLELNRCIVCTDGEQGGHTQTRIGLASSVHFVTRLAVYILLQTEHALANLDQATWERVEDSGSGPTRWASEFGNLDADEGEARLHRVEPGPWAHRGPVLAPRQLRRAFHDLSTQLQVAIHAAPIPTRPTPSKLFYRDAAHRQRRRRSWQKRVAWNERPENATVSISIIAPPDLQRILVTTRSPAVDAAGG